MPLADFDSHFPGRSIADHAFLVASSTGDKTLPSPGLALDGTVVARVDHGRWIADCPLEGCGGAEFVSLGGQGFFCTECRNAATGHQPVLVVLPGEKERAQIDAYLCARPAPATRNWRPGETVKSLQQENREHGVKIR